ncbi:MAG: Rho termination factor N-terminal domain-containing protein, partial [Actinomycetota bacterium]
MDKSVLEEKVLTELQEMASGMGVEGYQRLKKGDLIDAIMNRSEESSRKTAAEAGEGKREGGRRPVNTEA